MHLLLSMLFGSVGMGYFIYGRKQRKAFALLSGVALMGLPYFLPGAVLMTAVCVALMALPFATHKLWGV